MTNSTIRFLNLPRPLSVIATMTPGMEGQIKESLENYRPVCQRTVRSENTKDKAGALPPAVHTVHHTVNESEEGLRFPEENNVSSAIALPQRCYHIICGQRGCY